MYRIEEQFPYLIDTDLEKLSNHSTIVQFEKDTVIIEFGKYEPYFYFVLEGVVRGYSYTEAG